MPTGYTAKNAQWNLEYHAKGAAEDKETSASRAAWIKALKESVPA